MKIVSKIKARFPGLSRKQIQTYLTQGLILVNGKKLTKSHDLQDADTLALSSDLEKAQLQPDASVACQLVHQNASFLVFDKGVAVHSVAHDVLETGTAANWLLSIDDQLREVSHPLESGLLHRLDFQTSGLMVAARTKSFFENLSNQFREGSVVKEYVCDCEPGSLTKGLHEVWMRPNPKSSKRVEVRSDPHETEGWTLVKTHIDKIELLESGKQRVSLRLITGYRHQIRAHLKFWGAPLVNDTIYGQGSGEFFLRCVRLGFVDEVGESVEFKLSS